MSNKRERIVKFERGFDCIKFQCIHGSDKCFPGSGGSHGKHVGPLPVDLGYHSKTPQFDGQSAISESCEILDGEPCYYDGSGLNAHDALHTLVNGGEDALWEFLDSYYDCVFGDAEYPKPAEYKMECR